MPPSLVAVTAPSMTRVPTGWGGAAVPGARPWGRPSNAESSPPLPDRESRPLDHPPSPGSSRTAIRWRLAPRNVSKVRHRGIRAGTAEPAASQSPARPEGPHTTSHESAATDSQLASQATRSRRPTRVPLVRLRPNEASRPPADEPGANNLLPRAAGRDSGAPGFVQERHCDAARLLFVPGSRLMSGGWDACLPTTAGAPVMSENCPSRTR